jgi:hypothetical protein
VGGVKQGNGVSIAADGTLSVTGLPTQTANVRIVNTDNSQMTATDYSVWCVSSVTNITLPATPAAGQIVSVGNATAGNLVVKAQTGATIYGAATILVGSNGASILLQFDAPNSTWRPINAPLLQAGLGVYNSNLQPGSASVLGGVKQGTGVSIAADGTLTLAPTWQSWTPTITAAASMTVSGIVTNPAEYVRMGNLVLFTCIASFTLGGTASQYVYISAPIPLVSANIEWAIPILLATQEMATVSFSNANTLQLSRLNGTVWTLGTTYVNVVGFYHC